MRNQLCAGLQALNIEFDEHQIDACLAYLHLLLKWNKAFNLTAVTEPKKMVSYLLLDSLSLLPWLDDKNNILDVGTGAGLPGIPLAIFKPNVHWVLCDSNGKKTRFIQQACAELGLKNITVENKRIEDYHYSKSFDVILSKAYASLSDFVQSTQHLCSEKTLLITLKSGLADVEKNTKKLDEKYLEETFITIPGVSELRSIVTITSRTE